MNLRHGHVSRLSDCVVPAYRLHIVGALGFFIAVGVFYASVLGVRRAQTAGSIKLWTGAAATVSRLLFPISFLVILVAGLYMVVTR